MRLEHRPAGCSGDGGVTGRARQSHWAADPWHDAHAERYAESYLYDLEHDPYELVNLIGQTSHRDVARHLRERLLVRMEEE